MENIKVTIPRLYGMDAVERALDVGEVVKLTSREVTLKCTPAQLDELRSDAEYYADPVGFHKYVHGICKSAQATLKRLQKRHFAL